MANSESASIPGVVFVQLTGVELHLPLSRHMHPACRFAVSRLDLPVSTAVAVRVTG